MECDPKVIVVFWKEASSPTLIDQKKVKSWEWRKLLDNGNSFDQDLRDSTSWSKINVWLIEREWELRQESKLRLSEKLSWGPSILKTDRNHFHCRQTIFDVWNTSLLRPLFIWDSTISNSVNYFDALFICSPGILFGFLVPKQSAFQAFFLSSFLTFWYLQFSNFYRIKTLHTVAPMSLSLLRQEIESFIICKRCSSVSFVVWNLDFSLVFLRFMSLDTILGSHF